MARMIALVALLVAFPVSAAVGQTLPERYSDGVTAFNAGDYDLAANTFQELVSKFGVKEPEVWLNLGAASFEAERPGIAVYAFHKAAKLAKNGPIADTANGNLARVRTAMNEGQAETGFVFGAYFDAWTVLLGWINPKVALVVFLGFWSLFFVGLGLWRYSPSRRKGLAVVIFGAALIVAGLAAYGGHRVANYRLGVVISDFTPLRDDISSTKALARLPEGLELRVTDTKGAWLEVRLPSGQHGWVEQDRIAIP